MYSLDLVACTLGVTAGMFVAFYLLPKIDNYLLKRKRMKKIKELERKYRNGNITR